MDSNEMEGLEFDLEPDSPSPNSLMHDEAKAFIRKSFRVPIDETPPMSIQDEDEEFRVVNLSEGGVGFLLATPERFSRNDIIEALTLKVGQQTLTLRGRVAHISPHESGDCLCGLEFLDMNVETAQELRDILEKNQRRWFETR